MDETFTALFAELQGPIYRYAARRTTAEDAEDVVAETFAALWKGMARLPAAREEWRPWVFGIARRQLANHQRQLGRRQSLALSVRAALAAGVPVVEDETAEVVDGAEQGRWVFERLSPRDREVVQLAGWDGLSTSEIALVLGISATAVSTRAERARRRIAELTRLSETIEGDRAGAGVARRSSRVSPDVRTEAR